MFVFQLDCLIWLEGSENIMKNLELILWVERRIKRRISEGREADLFLSKQGNDIVRGTRGHVYPLKSKFIKIMFFHH